MESNVFNVSIAILLFLPKANLVASQEFKIVNSEDKNALSKLFCSRHHEYKIHKQRLSCLMRVKIWLGFDSLLT